MARIVIRNLDANMIERLQRLASVCGTSIEEQAGLALARAVEVDREVTLARLDEVRRSIGRREGPSSLEYLRRDRDRDG